MPEASVETVKKRKEKYVQMSGENPHKILKSRQTIKGRQCRKESKKSENQGGKAYDAERTSLY